MLTFASLGPVGAHDLLPRALRQFLAAHPNASPADIEGFLATARGLERAEPDLRWIESLAEPGSGFFDLAWTFVALGITHILTGADHLLFLVTVMLDCGSIGEILRLATIFTVAHSLTLILAGALSLSLRSYVVEPAIAFSIAWVAVDILRHHGASGRGRLKAAMVFSFGLVHGLGFAGSLTDLDVPRDRLLLSLIEFNVGIELGQLLVFGAVLPLLDAARARAWYPRLRLAAAAALITIGVSWGLERMLT